MELAPDPDWYFQHVLANSRPDQSNRPARRPCADWLAWWHDRAVSADSLLAAAAGQGFVLRVGQLPTLGVSRQNARTLVRRGAWTAAGYGAVAPIRVSSDVPFLAARRRHALLASARVQQRAGHVVSCRSAAVLHGLPTLGLPAVAELTAIEALGLGPRAAAHRFGASLTQAEITTWFGLPVTTVARTLVDLARHDRRDAITAADAALREELVLASDVDLALVEAAGWPGVRQARAVLALATPLAESPLESVTRLRLHEGRFPPFRLQVTIPGTAYRVDFLFDEQRLVLEADGLEKYTAAEVRREKRREQRLRALGYRVERVSWEDVLGRWPNTRQWLRAALAEQRRLGT